MIKIKYDDARVSDDKIVELSKAVQRIVIETTGIKDVFVYADSPKIKIDVAPIEIFVEMSAVKITNRDELFESLKGLISQWKKSIGFEVPINFTLIPMDWKFDVNI